MSKTIAMNASPRPRAGKGAARQARRDGLTPAVIYGGGAGPEPITVPYKDLNKALHEPGFFNNLIELSVDGKKQSVLCRDVQTHPVTDRPEHADFLRVSKTTRVTVEIPVVFHNEEKSPGLKRGGLLNVVRHTVECFVRADNIPERIDIDLTGVRLGATIHISQVNLPDGAEPTITDRDFTVATIGAPRGVSSSDEAEEDAASE
ncbi:MAG: 50S ribosomal protein L25/general stress protein Ctc [Pseudomonadota bacterium]